MSENVKQEGDFKLKRKPAMKKLDKPNVVSKVDLTIKKEETDAIQESITNESVLGSQESEVGLQEMAQGNTSNETITTQESQQEEVIIMQEVTDEEVIAASNTLIEEANKAIETTNTTGRKLPENVEKLVSFMEETGGTHVHKLLHASSTGKA